MRITPFAPPIPPPPPRSQTLFGNALGFRRNAAAEGGEAGLSNSVSLPGGNGISRTVAFLNRYPFSANGALSFEPGATPQELMPHKSLALKARFIAEQVQEEIRREASGTLNRAFSAPVVIRPELAAASSNESAPFALNMSPNGVWERGISCRTSAAADATRKRRFTAVTQRDSARPGFQTPYKTL
jgi:hypothetical protein